MGGKAQEIDRGDPRVRQRRIVDVLADAFADLMAADPAAFRRKFRKMAADPFAFYRGSACLFYADMQDDEDPWADERAGRVWIQGDLHAGNFGTYMDDTGVLVFDVNDFDEAYLGHFTWDLKRFAASVALLAWTKAISDEDIARLLSAWCRAYVDQVHEFVKTDADHTFSLRLDTTDGHVREALTRARMRTRVDALNAISVVDSHERRFRRDSGARELDENEGRLVGRAYEAYLETIPPGKRAGSLSYKVKDITGRSGFGIGSAGLPAYSLLVEGPTQALENDVFLSMKQGNVAAPSRIVDDQRVREYFHHHGHRTAVSRRALQAHSDPWLGHTSIDGVGFVVSEMSPYEVGLDWSSLTEPAEISAVLDYLGRATAKAHCVSDEDSEQTLVDFQTEHAIATAINGREDAFIQDIADFGMRYAQVVRDDHRLFVDAFREGQIPGMESSVRR